MKHHLFYTFLAIFLATSIVTLLGVTEVIEVREFYLRVLVLAFLVELAGAVIFLFKGARFFDEDENSKPDDLVMKSIGKLDKGIGLLKQKIDENFLHFKIQLLESKHLGPTPETDIMELIHYLQIHKDGVHHDLLNSALNAIANVLESGVRVNSVLKASLHSLIKPLPDAVEGNRARILDLLDKS